jgi:hypothetical protein
MVDQGSRVLLAGAVLAVLGSTGCAFLGPAALRGSRSAYNEAIVATNVQQVLAMIVRMRYGEPAGLLAVTSVTANLNIQGSAGAQFGIGPESNYSGNLVPLSAGFAFEENPTISYAPVQGAQYMRQLLSPLPLELTALMLRALRDSPQALTFLVRSINGIRNPDFLADPSVAVDPRFARLVGLLAELDRHGQAVWAQKGDPSPSFVLAITGEGETSASRIGELYQLLGFQVPGDLGSGATLPVRLGVGRPEEPGIHFETRSLFELLNIAAGSVEVPEEHLEAGLAHAIPPAGPAGQGIRIRRSKGRPDEAITAVRHHGWWYFIDATDTVSKLTFRIVESLISVRIADAVDHPRATPVLTVPVSR